MISVVDTKRSWVSLISVPIGFNSYIIMTRIPGPRL